MGISIKEFYSLTPRQFHNISKGFRSKQDYYIRLTWEQTRSITYAIALPNLPRKERNKSIEELMPFSWEKQPEEKQEMTKAEKDKMFAKWDKIEFKEQK